MKVKKDKDEFGLPTISSLVSAAISKGETGDNGDFNEMLTLLLKEREKLMTDKYGAGRAMADRFYNNLRICATNFAEGLEKPYHYQGYQGKDECYEVRFAFQDELSLFDFYDDGSIKASLFDDELPDDYDDNYEPTTIFEDEFHSYPAFMHWFINYPDTKWMISPAKKHLLSESVKLIEKPDEFGIPTGAELYNAYVKKLDSIENHGDMDKYNKAVADADAEYRDMIDARHKERNKKLKAANIDKLDREIDQYVQDLTTELQLNSEDTSDTIDAEKMKNGTTEIHYETPGYKSDITVYKDGSTDLARYMKDDKKWKFWYQDHYDTFADFVKDQGYDELTEYDESLNESPDEYGLPTYQELSDANKKHAEKDGWRKANVEYTKMRKLLRKERRDKLMKNGVSVGYVNADEYYKWVTRLSEKDGVTPPIPYIDTNGNGYALVKIYDGATPVKYIRFYDDDRVEEDNFISGRRTKGEYKTFNQFMKTYFSEYNESLNEAAEKNINDIPTYNDLYKSYQKKGMTDKNHKEFNEMAQLCSKLRWEANARAHGEIYANAKQIHELCQFVFSHDGEWYFKDKPNEYQISNLDWALDLYFDKKTGGVSDGDGMDLGSFDEFLETLNSSGLANIEDYVYSPNSWWDPDWMGEGESLNESPDEFGLPTQKELHRSYMRKRRDAERSNDKNAIKKIDKEYMDMETMRIDARSDKIRENTFNIRKSFNDYIIANLKHIKYLNSDKDLTDWNIVFYKTNFNQAYQPSLKVTDRGDGNVDCIVRESDGSTYEISRPWSGFVNWFNTYRSNFSLENKLQESLNESPDEYGLPTFDELADAHHKKDDSYDEYSNLLDLKSKERWKKVKDKYGEVIANGDQVLQYLNFVYDCELDHDMRDDGTYIIYIEGEDIPKSEWHRLDFFKNGSIYADSYRSVDKQTKIYRSFKEFVNDYFGNSHQYDSSVKDLFINEQLNEAAVSNGVYSLYNGWVKEPVKNDIPDIDQKEVDKLVQPYITRFNRCDTIDDIDELVDDIYVLRQEGILEDGEYSLKNLAFKSFRSDGYLDKLKKKKTELENKEMSLN